MQKRNRRDPFIMTVGNNRLSAKFTDLLKSNLSF